MYFFLYNSVIALLLLFILLIVFESTDSGANNMHLIDASNMHDIIATDILFDIIEPKKLRYTYRARPAKDFGASFKTAFEQRKALLVPVKPPYSCGYPTNADDIKGNIALIERGDCSFLSKTVRAQEAGAIAVIIADNQPFNDDLYIEMIDDETDRSPAIPAAFLLGVNGYAIRNTLETLNLEFAIVDIPLNLTYVPYHKMNQPRWLLW